MHYAAAESAHFGIAIARAAIANAGDCEQAERECREQGMELLVARIAAEDIALLQEMIASGYQLVDTLAYYRCKVSRVHRRVGSANVTVRPARRSDERGLLGRLARDCFRGYLSHYRADKRLSPELCDELYARWVDSVLLENDERCGVLVAEAAGEAIGFGVVKVDAEGVGEAVLAGVHPRYRANRLYAYRSLLWAGTRFAAERGAQVAFASTQIHNVVAQKIWASCGWSPSHFCYTLHRWFT